MENGYAEKYSTYILELVRNNGLTDNRRKRDKEGEAATNSFLLFGYFDILCCRKLIEKSQRKVSYVNIYERENSVRRTYSHSQQRLHRKVSIADLEVLSLLRRLFSRQRMPKIRAFSALI